MSFGNLALHHQNIDAAVMDLEQAARQMSESLNECNQAIHALLGAQEGDISVAAAAFHQTVRDNNHEMVAEINQASRVLEHMHQLILEADKRGGQGMHR